MKKYFTFGLIMSLVSGACFAEHPMITQLLQEKQAKMEKLQKCQGTTKNLKIAGISTLGVTAVGVGANIAEAVVLSNTKEEVKKAKKSRDAQQTIKDKRECEQDSTKIWQNGECKDKPVITEKEKKQENSDGNAGNGDKDSEKQDKPADDKKSGNANGKKQNEDKGGAGTPAPAGEESDTDESEPEEAPQKSDEELFKEACINAGYRMAGSVCFICDFLYTIPVPESKAYVDNALITAARKMNMGCNGSIYTEQNSHSYIDCLGGRLMCAHKTTAIEDDTKKQAEALLKDIEKEKDWENKRQQTKQVDVPLKPTPEQAEQPKPQVSWKPEVLKNIERADEIINNKLPCKDDEEFNSIMNACVKK